MKHWNYRVIEFAANGDEPAWRELREVYYDNAGKPSAYGAVAKVAWSAEDDPATPHALLERMREALGRVGDCLKFEVISEGRCSFTNLSKAEREAPGTTT